MSVPRRVQQLRDRLADLDVPAAPRRERPLSTSELSAKAEKLAPGDLVVVYFRETMIVEEEDSMFGPPPDEKELVWAGIWEKPNTVYYSPPWGDFNGPKRPARLEFPPKSSNKVKVEVLDLWVHRPRDEETNSNDDVDVSSMTDSAATTANTGSKHRPPLAPKKAIPQRRTDEVINVDDDSPRQQRDHRPKARTHRDHRNHANDSDEEDDWDELDDENDNDDDSDDLDCKSGIKALKLHKLRRQRQLQKIANTGDESQCWLRPRDILDEERWLFPSEIKPAEYSLAIDQMYAQWRDKLSEAGRILCSELTEALKTWNKLWHRTRQGATETCCLLTIGSALVGQILFQLAIPCGIVPDMAAAIKKIKSLKVLDYEKATALLITKPSTMAPTKRQGHTDKRQRDDSSSAEDSPPRQRRFHTNRQRYSDRRPSYSRDRNNSDRRRQGHGRESFSRGGGRPKRRGRER